jgi:predicted nucleotidyltransferase
MLNRDNVIKIISDISKNYSDIFGSVILFGSVEKGTNTESSDIDLYAEPIDKSITTGKFDKSTRLRE